MTGPGDQPFNSRTELRSISSVGMTVLTPTGTRSPSQILRTIEYASRPISSNFMRIVVRFRRGTFSLSESSTPMTLTSSGTRLPAALRPRMAP